jgi:hypothetical protein
MKKIMILLLLLLLLPVTSFSQEIGDYLILQDIGGYKYRPKPTKRIYGSSGVLIGAGHFDLDHDDITYETRYIMSEPILGVEVKVTQHAGRDSDKWLLHEVEDSYRDGDDSKGRLGLLSGVGVKIRQIDGNKVFYWGLGGGSYTWVSGLYKVIEIKYVDLQRRKPEPLEVIKAYLSKHPSSMTLTDIELKSAAHNEQWIKEEMERRLWLCDKWLLQVQMGKVQLSDALRTIVDCMVVFLDYREKYYGMSAKDEKVGLYGYLSAKDGTSIKNKLTEYKNWWNVNKARSINLP